VVEEVEEISIPLPKVGEKIKAKVKAIYRGRVEELVPIERIRNDVVRQRYENMKGREAIQLVLDIGGFEVRRTIPISTRPNSRFYRLMKKYGKLRKGMEIEVTTDANGRLRIVYD